MKLDAPQLSTHSLAVSDDGRACQFTLTNAAGQSLSFTLSARQIGYLSGLVQSASAEMQKRLLANEQAATAEMLAALAEPFRVKNCVVGERGGEPQLLLELEEGGRLSVVLTPSLSTSLMTALLKQTKAGTSQ